MRPVRLLAGILTVGAWTLLSRILGFARDVIIAGLIGPGVLMDAFVAAFRLPNMFRRFFAEVRSNSILGKDYYYFLKGVGIERSDFHIVYFLTNGQSTISCQRPWSRRPGQEELICATFYLKLSSYCGILNIPVGTWLIQFMRA